jgi:hypothetical protein
VLRGGGVVHVYAPRDVADVELAELVDEFENF